MSAAVITRRDLVGAAGAALGAVGLLAAASALASPADLDAELFALLDRWHEARAAWDATDAPLDEALGRAVAAYPPMPAALWSTGDFCFHLDAEASGRGVKPSGYQASFYCLGNVEKLRASPPVTRWAIVADDVDPPPREPDPEGEARRQEIIAAHDAWEAACQCVRDEVGFTAASNAEDDAQAEWNAADEAVKLYQPRTLAGLMRKAGWVADRLAGGGCDDDLGEVFARQVASFGGVTS